MHRSADRRRELEPQLRLTFPLMIRTNGPLVLILRSPSTRRRRNAARLHGSSPRASRLSWTLWSMSLRLPAMLRLAVRCHLLLSFCLTVFLCQTSARSPDTVHLVSCTRLGLSVSTLSMNLSWCSSHNRMWTRAPTTSCHWSDDWRRCANRHAAVPQECVSRDAWAWKRTHAWSFSGFYTRALG